MTTNTRPPRATNRDRIEAWLSAGNTGTGYEISDALGIGYPAVYGVLLQLEGEGLAERFDSKRRVLENGRLSAQRSSIWRQVRGAIVQRADLSGLNMVQRAIAQRPALMTCWMAR